MPPPAALPTICTSSLLLSLRRHPHLPHHAWYIVAGVTLSGLNRPDELGRVLHHALEHGAGRPPAGPTARAEPAPTHAEQLRIARRLREALVRASAIQGLPKAINALLALKRETPAHLLDAPGAGAAEGLPGRAAELADAAPARVLVRGRRFFDRTYGKVAERVMGQMDGCGTEDLGAVARLAYGYVLSPPALLEPQECSFVLLAGLIPQDVNPQLKGHLKGALNNGATVEEVRAVRETAIRVCEAAGMTGLSQDSQGGWGWRGEVANL